jgi:hypothetical protein
MRRPDVVVPDDIVTKVKAVRDALSRPSSPLLLRKTLLAKTFQCSDVLQNT